MSTAKKARTIVTTAPAVLRRPEAQAYLGLAETAFAELIASGNLPKPVKLNDEGRAIGWVRSELDDWVAKRIAKRDAEKRAERDSKKESGAQAVGVEAA